MSDVLVDFDLSYPVYFEEEGSVTFRYRKDSIGSSEFTYGTFQFLIDDLAQIEDREFGSTDWQDGSVDEIPAGYHSLVWRYTKLNVLPYTEFMEAEIEQITVRGRHSDRVTQCFPCRLGHSMPGSAKCDLCEENHFFFVDESFDYFCKPCDTGYYSTKGSVGELACQPRRPCDEGDLDVHTSTCVNGKQNVSY